MGAGLFLIIGITLKQVGVNLLAGSLFEYFCCVAVFLSHINVKVS